VLEEKQFISLNHIIAIQARLVETNAGFRKLPGTALHNEQTGATVYTPPQNYQDILAHMTNLEAFINNDALSDCDPLVKMAITQHKDTYYQLLQTTKIEFIMNDLQVSRITAGKYLNQLSAINIMDKHKLGKENYYINIALYEFLANVNELIKL
jgi:Fic family protein